VIAYQQVKLNWLLLKPILVFTSSECPVDTTACIAANEVDSTSVDAEAVEPSCQGDVAVSVIPTETAVPRLCRCKQAIIVHNRSIPIVHYSVCNRSPLSSLSFRSWLELQMPYALPDGCQLDVLWQVGCFVKGFDGKHPSWTSFMHDLSAAESGVSNFVNVTDFRMCPILDLNPNDMTCIYSTLLYIIERCKILGVTTPCVTFDQPLWLKAVEVTVEHNLNIVCRLGPFHMMMSYLGSLGSVMLGSGLTEVLQTCFGPNTVGHMMSGKAVSKAVRGHFLVDGSLTILLLKIVTSKDFCETNCSELLAFCSITSDDVTEIENMYIDVTNGNKSFTDVACCQAFQRLQQAKQKLQDFLAYTSRTAKLWLQYIQCVKLLKLFIRAERTSDWHLHLYAFSQMLPLFAATGHNNYAKSGRLYLQMMSELPEEHNLLYKQFVLNGCHSVRRSHKLWSGLSTDLAIEQVMMKELKSRGGLTHGRGLTDSVRLMWVSTMHKMATVHSSLNSLLALDGVTQDFNHKESGSSRIQRDNNDMKKMLTWFENHNPFHVADGRLRNLWTGIAAGDTDQIDCDSAMDIGCKIMEKLDGLPFTDIILKKCDQVTTLSTLTSRLSIGTKNLNVDANVLFNRLLIIMSRLQIFSRTFHTN
jgi:hypothetical protein